MGTLKVIVRNDALNFMQEVTHWYECTMGRKAAQKFTDDIRNTISTLSRFPGIGTLEHNRSTATTKYLSFYKNDPLYSGDSCYYDETDLVGRHFNHMLTPISNFLRWVSDITIETKLIIEE